MLHIAICSRRQSCAEMIQYMTFESMSMNGIHVQYYLYSTANEFLQSNMKIIDILFVEVEMDDCNGIDLGRTFRKSNINGTIVLIAEDLKYAAQGYTVNAFRYLLRAELENVLSGCVQDIIERLHVYNDKLVVKTRQTRFNVPLADIRYLESEGRRIRIFIGNEQAAAYVYYAKLSVLNQILSQKGFLWVNKSFLINMKYIVQMKNRKVVLNTNEVFNCSKANYKENAEHYMLWKASEIENHEARC